MIVEDSTVMGVTQQLSAITTNEGDMDTGGGGVGGVAEGGASNFGDQRTIEQNNPFGHHSSSASFRLHQSPLLPNLSPGSSSRLNTSSGSSVTDIDTSNNRHLTSCAPLELNTLVSNLTESRLPDIISNQGQSTLLQMSGSDSTQQQQQHGNGTGQQDSMMTSGDFGVGNIYPS